MYAKLSNDTLRQLAAAKAQLAAVYNTAADEAGEDPDSRGLFRQNARDAASGHEALTKMLLKRLCSR